MIDYLIDDCSGVILAGGKNTRYGGFHKAFLRVENQFIIENTLNILKSIFSDNFIIANNKVIFSKYQLPVYSDIFFNRGPIGGIHSALQHTSKKSIFVVSCDMPFIDKSIILKMYEKFKSSNRNACVPKHDNNIEPLHSIYSKEILKDLENHLQNSEDNAIYKFLSTIDIEYLNFESSKQEFVNINSPEDLELLNKL